MTVTVTREDLASCRCKLDIEVDVATVNQTRDAIVRDVRKRTVLPGFRRGKAPRKMIESKYADTIQTELMQRIVAQAYHEALQQEHIHPLSDPEVEQVAAEDQKPLTFTAVLDVRPEIEVGEYKGLELTRPSGDVSDAEVDEVLQNLQERHAEYESQPDRAAAMGDIVVIDFQCTIDGEPFEGGGAENYPLHLGEGRMLPGFEEHLQGRTQGEEVDFSITFPEEYPSAEVAGKQAEVHATVREVKLKKLLPLDDDFAKDVGEVDSLDALRAKVSEDLGAYKESQAQSALRDQALDKLLELSQVDVPARLHERARQRIVREAEQRMRQQGASDAQLAEHREAIAQQASEQAAKQIRSSFLIDTVAHGENLHATEDEVKARIATFAERPGIDMKAVRTHFGNPDERSNLRQQIEVEKVLDFLVAHATITTVEAESPAAEESD